MGGSRAKYRQMGHWLESSKQFSCDDNNANTRPDPQAGDRMGFTPFRLPPQHSLWFSTRTRVSFRQNGGATLSTESTPHDYDVCAFQSQVGSLLTEHNCTHILQLCVFASAYASSPRIDGFDFFCVKCERACRTDPKKVISRPKQTRPHGCETEAV